MARLNEPPAMAPDSIETLRKKFLRQNRDIARVNSNQSLRIRALENECARLLSENLDLRGKILQLERETADNSASRIADHALQIKAKMEAQLIEWGSMLASLGLEPPPKRHSSPGARRISRSRTSMGRSPAQRKMREARDTEAAAMREGRLAPIPESKAYPRQTMNRDEILALVSEAADKNDSPDLGPPPTSRFVEEDPVKVDSPSKSTGVPHASPKAEATAPLPPVEAVAPKLDYGKKQTLESEHKTEVAPVQAESRAPAKAMEPEPVRSPSTVGSKRKFGDENESSRITSDNGKENRTGPSKPHAVRDIKNRKSIREISSIRRDGKDMQITSSITRKPLAAKSTNDDMTSPRKVSKTMSLNDMKTAASDPIKKAPVDDTAKSKQKAVPIRIQIPASASLPAISHPLEPVTPAADQEVIGSASPELRSVTEQVRDTPPPGDISLHGETTRPSRRARVSYAEPNLRVKMRRPTKELFDAVSGEGKFKQLSSAAHQIGLASTTKVKVEGEGSESWKELPAAEAAVAHEVSRRGSVLSPLAHKEQPPADLPSSVATERRRRPSSARESLYAHMDALEADVESSKNIEAKRRGIIVVGDADPYEFQSSSPMNESAELPENSGKGRSSKESRRSSAIPRGGSGSTTDRPIKAPVSRKRASMAAPKKSTLLDDAPEDDQFEPGGQIVREPAEQSSGTDKMSRRRSMML